VALGTSLPDTFASKTAAANEKNADNAIGNVTGSNSVNVFLGLGLPWVIAAFYHYSKVSTLFQPKNALVTPTPPQKKIGYECKKLRERVSP
jgi:solute carrier family 8 (sodium/calcium exchanger)